MPKRAAIMIRRQQNCPMRLAFGAGLERRGWQVENVSPGSELPDCELLVAWGTRIGHQYFNAHRARGGKVCVLERAYLGDRFHWTSVSFGGGLNGKGEFVTPNDPRRFHQHFGHLLQPWHERTEGYVLVLGQIATDMSLAGAGDINEFYHSATFAFKAQGYSVLFRPHPGNSRTRTTPLASTLSGALFTVSYNSNSSVDSVLAGVPSITMDRGAMAWDVTGHDFTVPPRPERQAWAERLAWCQYQPSEMASGFCHEVVGL